MSWGRYEMEQVVNAIDRLTAAVEKQTEAIYDVLGEDSPVERSLGSIRDIATATWKTAGLDD